MIGSPEPAPCDIAGAVGKRSTARMIDAVFADSSQERRRAVVVLSPDSEVPAAHVPTAHVPAAHVPAQAVPGPDSRRRPWRDLLLGLDGDSVAVLTADHGGVTAPMDSPARVVTFGLTDSAQFRATDIDATLDGTSFMLHHTGLASHHSEQTPVRLQLLGEHQVVNCLAALALAHASGIALLDVIAKVEALPSLGRGRLEPIRLPDDIIVIDDAISALPQSVTAALKTLALVSGQRRSVAVLSELETDDADPREAHDRIGRLVVRLNVKKLIVVGQAARHIHNAAGLEGSWDGESVLVDTVEEAYDLLREEVRPGDVVLVKSSKQAGLASLVERLAESRAGAASC